MIRIITMVIFTTVFNAALFSQISLACENITVTQTGYAYLIFDDLLPDIRSITWEGPNGFISSGINTPRLAQEGLYCVTVLNSFNCVAQGCIIVQKCQNIQLANGWTLSTCAGRKVFENGPLFFPIIGSGGSLSNTTPSVSISTTYPNPFQDQINIEVWSSSNQTASIQLLNSLGNTVLNQQFSLLEGSNFIEINLSGGSLASGAYYLRVIDSNGLQDAKTLLKN